MFGSNYLTMLMKPNYENFVDSAQDVLDRDLTVVSEPGYGSTVKASLNSEYEIDRKLAERTVVPKVIFYT